MEQSYGKTLVVIVGPTGSGKTDLAVDIAGRLNAPIVSTDSRQVYRGMTIGSARPTTEQLAAVPHYFIADREVTQRFTCADFEKEALALLDKFFTKQIGPGTELQPEIKTDNPTEERIKPELDFVVAVGGSGLYVDALCNGLDILPDIDVELRKELTNRLSRYGLQPLAEQLKELDPVYYEAVDRRNPARVIRALEVCLQTGKPFSSFRTGSKTDRPFNIIKIGTELPRPELYERIDRRVDGMMAAGLETEARTLYRHKHLPALQTVGYRELFGYFDGEYDLARAVELIKRNSRRYAKRQLTWFKRDRDIRWFHPSETNAIMTFIEQNI